MLIKHKIENNQVVVYVRLKAKRYGNQRTLIVDTEYLMKYCNEKEIPIGSLIKADKPCGNTGIMPLDGTWTFGLSREYKKNLILGKKNDIIKHKPKTTKSSKTSSVRSRARKVVQKTRAKKNPVLDTEKT